MLTSTYTTSRNGFSESAVAVVGAKEEANMLQQAINEARATELCSESTVSPIADKDAKETHSCSIWHS